MVAYPRSMAPSPAIVGFSAWAEQQSTADLIKMRDHLSTLVDKRLKQSSEIPERPWVAAPGPTGEHDYSTTPAVSWDYEKRLQWCFNHHDWEEVDA